MGRNTGGLHIEVVGSHSGYGDYLRRCADAGKPVGMVKGFFDGGVLMEAKSVCPQTITIWRGRPLDIDEDNPHSELDWLWPPDKNEQYADEWMTALYDRWRLDKDVTDYLEIVNEPNGGGNPLQFENQRDFFIECMKWADLRDFKIAIGSFSSGCPTEWQTQILAPSFDYAARHGHIVALHDGSVDEERPLFLQATEDGTAYRYRMYNRVLDSMGLMRPRYAITEGYRPSGYRGMNAAGWADMRAYLQELARDGVLGWAWFSLGDYDFGGGSVNVVGQLPKYTNMLIETDWPDETPPPEPPPPVSNDIVLQVPFTSQVNEITYNACGPACAAILELYQYGIARTALDWWAATGANPTQPVTFAQMERAANSFGYYFRIERDKSLAELSNLLNSGVCPMLLVNAAYLEYCATTSAHFVLCVGKLASGAYMIHDPYTVRQMGGAFVIQHDLANAWGNCYLQGNPNNTWLILEKAITPPPPPTSNAMSGVSMASARPLTANETEAARISGVTAFKALTIQDPGEAAQLIEQVRYIKPDMLIVARLMFPPDSENRTPFSPQTFIDYCGGPALTYYGMGVRHFEIHNEPNLALEGNDWNWANGIEFAEWFDDVFYILRRMMPNAMFGFPGLSPQADDIAGICDASDAFLQNARSAVLASDWLGVHSYWQERGMGHWQMQSEDYGGWYYRKVQRAFPGKSIFITEYSCNNPNITDVDKGRMYRDYVADLPGVEAAFAFCLSWDYDPNREAFVRGGAITDIPRALGGLL